MQILADVGLGFVFLLAGYEIELVLFRQDAGWRAMLGWLISVVIAIFGLRKVKAGGGAGLARAAGLISMLLLAAYVVTIWAMTTKPV